MYAKIYPGSRPSVCLVFNDTRLLSDIPCCMMEYRGLALGGGLGDTWGVVVGLGRIRKSCPSADDNWHATRPINQVSIASRGLSNLGVSRITIRRPLVFGVLV